MVKLIINPYTYVGNLAAIITCWVFVKSAINQQGFIWIDKIFLVLVCLLFTLIVLSATYGNAILLWAYSSDRFKNKKNFEDIIASICNKNPVRIFRYLKLQNYQFREALLRNLHSAIIRKINYFDKDEIFKVMDRVMALLQYVVEIDLRQRLLKILITILDNFPDVLKYELHKDTIQMLRDFVNLQIKEPLEERQDTVLDSLNVLKCVKFKESEEKMNFYNWKQKAVKLINLILEPFDFEDDKKLIVKENLIDKVPTIMIISSAYKKEQEQDEEQNYENLKRLRQIKELLIT